MIWDEFYEHPIEENPPEAEWNRRVHRAAVDVVAEAKKETDSRDALRWSRTGANRGSIVALRMRAVGRVWG